MAMHFPAIITLLSLLLFLVTVFAVGAARTKYGIKAPATTGNADFERIFRVQMNTLESLVLFLPVLWLFSIYVSLWWTGIIGLMWILGRIFYAVGYARKAEGRTVGYGISLLAFAILAIGSAVGIVMRILAGL